MKENLLIYRSRHCKEWVSPRPGEIKLGERIAYGADLHALKKEPATFVILGIPEDIGIRGNRGRGGSSAAWKDFLQSFLNIQVNPYIDPDQLLLLGEVNVKPEMERADRIDPSDPNYFLKLGELTSEVDRKVTDIIRIIVVSGKIPIVIGGGHNNAYGIIRGTSSAIGDSINAINIDAHTDLRSTEFRHSGNGFTFAIKEGYLRNYAVYGLHQNYTPGYIFDTLYKEKFTFTLLESLSETERIQLFPECLNSIKSGFFGLEVDCDAVAGFPSSAFSPAGFSLEQARALVRIASREVTCRYLHVCEAIPSSFFQTGKALTYLVTDFITSNPHYIRSQKNEDNPL